MTVEKFKYTRVWRGTIEGLDPCNNCGRDQQAEAYSKLKHEMNSFRVSVPLLLEIFNFGFKKVYILPSYFLYSTQLNK